MIIQLDNIMIKVKVVPKKIKNIYMRFDEDRNLVVSCPKRVNMKEIEDLISKNQKSLIKMYYKVINRQGNEGEFKYLGNTYKVIYKEDSDIVFKDNIVIASNKTMLDKFLNNMLKQSTEEEIDELKKVIKTPDFEVRFRKMKTRWGVCNYKNMTITLNSELIKYKRELLRYVIVHEMCHFYHHDHSANFWEMVSKYYPNYKEARKELRG